MDITKLHPLTHPYMVNSAHLITCSPHVKFQHDWYINYFLTTKLTSYQWVHDQATPIYSLKFSPGSLETTCQISAYLVLQLACNSLRISCLCGYGQPHPMWLIMLTQVLGHHSPNFILIDSLYRFRQPEQLPVCVAMTKPHPLPYTNVQ